MNSILLWWFKIHWSQETLKRNDLTIMSYIGDNLLSNCVLSVLTLPVWLYNLTAQLTMSWRRISKFLSRFRPMLPRRNSIHNHIYRLLRLIIQLFIMFTIHDQMKWNIQILNIIRTGCTRLIINRNHSLPYLPISIVFFLHLFNLNLELLNNFLIVCHLIFMVFHIQ